MGRVKSRGRNILEHSRELQKEKAATPTDSIVESDEEGLGGCEFFPAFCAIVAIQLC